jgi:hypothetical protein
MKKLPDNQKKQYLQKQYVRLVENIAKRTLKEMNLRKDDLKNLIEYKDELQARIVAGIKNILMFNGFTNDKEVEPNCGYPNDYKIKSISEQIKILHQLFPNIGSADEKLVKQPPPLPLGAEGWFAIPRWEKIAPTYNEAVQKVIDLIKWNRNGNLLGFRENQLGPEYLRQSQRSIKAFQKLGNRQKGYDILVVPAQSGILHRGQSVREARKSFTANEFGLGVFAVGIILLTHSKRFKEYSYLYYYNLGIECAGDEFNKHAVLFFDVCNYGLDMLVFEASRADDNDLHCGSASAFLSW